MKKSDIMRRRILIPMKDRTERFVDDLKELHLSMISSPIQSRKSDDGIPDDVKETIELALIITETAYMSMFAVHPVMENLIFAHSRTEQVKISVEDWIKTKQKQLKYRLLKFYKEGIWSGDRDELFHEGLYLEEEYEEGD